MADSTLDFEAANSQANELIQQAVGILKQQPTIPTYGGVSTAPVRKELKRLNTSRDSMQQTIAAEQERFANATTAEKEALAGMGQAEAEKAYADAERARRVSDVTAYYGRLFGVDMDPSAPIATMAKGLREGYARADAKRRDLQELQSTNLIDNPIDWLVNQFKVDAAAADYNREADGVNSMQAILNDSIQTAASAAQFMEKSIPTTTAAQAKAVADKALANAQKLSADADQALSRTNVDYASKKFANDLAVAGATLNSTQLEMQNAHQVYASKIQAIQLQETNAARLIKAADLLETIEKKQEAREATKALNTLLEKFDNTMGHAPGTTNKTTFDKMPSAARENIVAVAAGSLGAGPYTALENFQRARPGPGINPNTLKMYELLNNEANAINKAEVTANTPKELVAEKMDKILINRVAERYRNASQMGNPFYELSPAEMIAGEAVGSSTQLAKALEPLAKTQGAIPTEFVVSTIMANFQNPTEAGQIVAEYYKRNIALRNTSMNASLFGITLNQEYPVRGVYGSRNYDLTNPADATKYVLNIQQKHRLQQSGNWNALGSGPTAFTSTQRNNPTDSGFKPQDLVVRY